jgi:hypothetical protein
MTDEKPLRDEDEVSRLLDQAAAAAAGEPVTEEAEEDEEDRVIASAKMRIAPSGRTEWMSASFMGVRRDLARQFIREFVDQFEDLPDDLNETYPRMQQALCTLIGKIHHVYSLDDELIFEMAKSFPEVEEALTTAWRKRMVFECLKAAKPEATMADVGFLPWEEVMRLSKMSQKEYMEYWEERARQHADPTDDTVG